MRNPAYDALASDIVTLKQYTVQKVMSSQYAISQADLDLIRSEIVMLENEIMVKTVELEHTPMEIPDEQ